MGDCVVMEDQKMDIKNLLSEVWPRLMSTRVEAESKVVLGTYFSVL